MTTLDLAQRSQHYTTRVGEETAVQQQINLRHCKAWLAKEWACHTPGHTVCVPTSDREHYQLSDENLEVWAKALCLRDIILPLPGFVLDSRSSFGTYLKCIEEGKSRPEAILGALLREKHHVSSTADSNSFGGGSLPSLIADESLQSSVGLQTRRYQFVKAVKWLPVRRLNTLDSDIVIRKRMEQHISLLKSWQETRHTEVGTDMQVEIFEILEDALEMSRACYSRRANKDAALIGLEIQRWILSCPGASVSNVTASWLCRLYVGLFPLFLGGSPNVYKSLSVVGDVSEAQQRLEELLDTVTCISIGVRGSKTISSVIKIISKSLRFMPYVFPFTPLIGGNFVRIIEAVLHLRFLNQDELDAVRYIASLRLESTERSPGSARPWEVVLCAQCAQQEPLMREVVVGATGLQSLLHAFMGLSRPWSRRSRDRKHMVDILEALQRLSRYSWLCDTVDPGLLDLWKNLCRGGILEQLFISRLKAGSMSRTVAYSPVTGRRTIAHKTGLPAFEGPMSPVNEYTPLEEYYKQETEYHIKSICMGMGGWAHVTELVSSSPSPAEFPVTFEAGAFAPPSPSTDASSLDESCIFSTQTSVSSLLPGIGYLSAKALRWIGDGSLDTVAHAIIWKRTNHHLSRLRKWKRQRCVELNDTMQKKLFSMICDALGMAHPLYSSRVNNYATSIGVELQQWLMSCVDASVFERHPILFARIHVCICSTILATVSEAQGCVSHQELLGTIQRVPLDLDDPTVTSMAIRIVSKEISRSSCSAGRNGLAISFMEIVRATLRSRLLTYNELAAIRDILSSRINRNCGTDNCHPWEVAIFAECASQEPSFAEVVLGDHGILNIVSVLQELLSNPTTSHFDWDHLDCIVNVLNRLSRHAWIANMVEPGVIGLLLNIFSRTDQDLHIRLRYSAIQTIQNIVSQPGRCRCCFTSITATPSSPHCGSDPLAVDGSPRMSLSVLDPLHSIQQEESIRQDRVHHHEAQTTPVLHQGTCKSAVKGSSLPGSSLSSMARTPVEISETASQSLTCRMNLDHNGEADSRDHGIFSDKRALEDRRVSQMTLVSAEGVGHLTAMPGAWIECGIF